MQAENNAYAVILAGGGGTRLWPKSRKAHPKHLLKLFGEDSLLRITYDRIAPIIPAERIFVITAKDHADQIYSNLPELPKENIIIEPQAKNTALAMGVAAAFVAKKDPNGVIINLAADHIYKDIERFQDTAIAALDVASKYDYIVAIGIKPNYAHTGLGYIKIGDQLGHVKVIERDLYAFEGLGFKEKPDRSTAQAFLASGKYLWNANLYTWSAQTIFKAFDQYSPDLAECLNEIKDAIGTPDQEKVMEQVYEKARSTQIDIAVSEKAKNLVVIPGDFGWSDIGDWKVVYDTLKKDNLGNALVGSPDKSIALDTRDTLIETNGKLVVTIGLKDMVVIDTDDAILICPKDRTQDVKKIVEQLKEEEKTEFL
jgi:mannose-1-phosphate guanylyltransferase